MSILKISSAFCSWTVISYYHLSADVICSTGATNNSSGWTHHTGCVGLLACLCTALPATGILCLRDSGILSCLPQLSSPLTDLPICHYTASVGQKPLQVSPDHALLTQVRKESQSGLSRPGVRLGQGPDGRDASGGRIPPEASEHGLRHTSAER